MIHRLIPTCKDYIWGGTRLKNEFGKRAESETIAESWELSCHPDGPSRLAGSGVTLAEHLTAHPSASGTRCAAFPNFPLLVKLIDADKALSVQVHPDDAYAMAHEGQSGKTEMWYVLDCSPGAFIYYGFQHEIGRDRLEAAIKNNTLENELRRVPVHPGDVFFIEAGTVHAIGAGCLIAEIQQNSNLVYRMYDYGRLGADGKPRQLHIRQACEAAKLLPARETFDFSGHLGQCRFFTTDLRRVDGGYGFNIDGGSFHGLLFIAGSADVSCGGETIAVGRGDCLFADAASGDCRIDGKCAYLDIYV